MQLSDFIGTWTLTRRIDDRRTGTAGSFTGRAVFRPEGAELAYREEGVLRLGPGPGFTASRAYRWQAVAGGIAVLFEDGRFFHALALDDAPRAEAGHDCGADRYAVRYDFRDWPDWRAVWEVRGPRKDYRMESLYSRAD